MNCKVTITGAGNPTVSQGALFYTDAGFSLDYLFEGDRCRLFVSHGTVTLSRRGSFDYDVTFKEGEETACVLHCGGLSGSVPVKTLFLSASKTGDRADVKLKYLLGGEKTEINLSASVV